MEGIIYGYLIPTILGLFMHFTFIDFEKTGRYVTKNCWWPYTIPIVGLVFTLTLPFDSRIIKRYDKVEDLIYFLPVVSLLGLYFLI